MTTLPYLPPTPGEDDLEEALRRVESLLRRAFDATDQFVSNVNRVLSLVPGFIGDSLRRAAERVVALVEQAAKAVWDLLSNPGSASALRSAGGRWTNDVGRHAGETAGLISTDEFVGDNHWSGRAAENYKGVMPRQARALEAVKTISDEVHNLLVAIANALVAFWVAIAVATATLVGALVVAAAAAVGVVTAPPAAATAAAALAAYIAFVGASVTALVAYTNSVMERTAKAQQLVTGNPAFPDGSWPVPASDFSD